MNLPDIEPDHPEAGSRDYRLGVEIEYPTMANDKARLTGAGVPDTSIPEDTGRYLDHHLGGEITSERIGDSTRGTEIRTPDDGLHYEDIIEWYKLTLDELEEQSVAMEPTGVFGESSAGLHIHISPITEETARELWRISQEPWMHIFACSSIVLREQLGSRVLDAPVLRSPTFSDWCNLDEFSNSTSPFGTDHTASVNRHHDGGVGHFEWRVPEPMEPESFELLIGFLARFLRDPDDASVEAKAKVYNGDERLTSVKRLRAIGDYDRTINSTEATSLLKEVVDSRSEQESTETATAD